MSLGPEMQTPNIQPMHIPEDYLDRYASGALSVDLLPSVEEHLLSCSACQSRLVEADEFLRLFRLAASEIELNTVPFWKRIFHSGPAKWAGAAALLAVSLAVVEISFRDAPAPEAIVLMQSLRGPDTGARITAGKPARLVFDLASPVAAGNCKLQIVDEDGAGILETATSPANGRLVASVKGLARGDYWARLYCGDNEELLVEYGLKSN
jgi:hypothetical protein